MDLEQLKLILEALKGVSQDAGSLFTLWLWLKFASGVLSDLLLFGGALGVVYGIYRAVTLSNGDDDNNRFMRNMRDQLRIGSPGHMTPGERHETMLRLRELVAEATKK